MSAEISAVKINKVGVTINTIMVGNRNMTITIFEQIEKGAPFCLNDDTEQIEILGYIKTKGSSQNWYLLSHGGHLFRQQWTGLQECLRERIINERPSQLFIGG